VDEQIKTLAHTYTQLFCHKKEDPAICDNIDEPEDIMLGEISQKGKYCVISLTCAN
jgi:hypothetical protein